MQGLSQAISCLFLGWKPNIAATSLAICGFRCRIVQIQSRLGVRIDVGVGCVQHVLHHRERTEVPAAEALDAYKDRSSGGSVDVRVQVWQSSVDRTDLCLLIIFNRGRIYSPWQRGIVCKRGLSDLLVGEQDFGI